MGLQGKPVRSPRWSRALAIFSLRHTPIGRSTQAQPYTAAAHVKYITRPQAARHVMAARMPDKPTPAAAYLRQMEDGGRVNARIADKVMLALPKELTQQQRVQLVRDFANDVTQNRAPWLAAIHDRGKDAANPHCHLLIRDRDPATGKRVIGMSDAGSTEMLREKWEHHANQALQRAGHAVRIDRRSLKDQGIDRAPTIHEGPNVRAMEARGARPRSRLRLVRNGRGARNPSRRVDYRTIDKGRTRPAYNRSLRAAETEADFWEAIDRDQQRRDFAERGLGADYARWEKREQSSMNGIGRLAHKPQQIGHRVPAPDKLRPLPSPFTPPGGPARIARSPGALEPATDSIAGRQRQDNLADQFSARPVRAPFRGERPEGRKTEEHSQSMDKQPKIARGAIMSEKDGRIHQQIERQRDEAKLEAEQSRGRFDDLMSRSYRDPKAAEGKMDAFRAKHGNEKLYEKLDHQTLGSPYGRGVGFGRRPGSIASPDGYKPGAGEARQDSHIARRQLPEATRKMHEDQEKLRGAERTVDNNRPARPRPQMANPPPQPVRRSRNAQP
jgi:hypothetical protein